MTMRSLVLLGLALCFCGALATAQDNHVYSDHIKKLEMILTAPHQTSKDAINNIKKFMSDGEIPEFVSKRTQLHRHVARNTINKNLKNVETLGGCTRVYKKLAGTDLTNDFEIPVSFSGLLQAEAYCDSHSECKGIVDLSHKAPCPNDNCFVPAGGNVTNSKDGVVWIQECASNFHRDAREEPSTCDVEVTTTCGARNCGIIGDECGRALVCGEHNGLCADSSDVCLENSCYAQCSSCLVPSAGPCQDLFTGVCFPRLNYTLADGVSYEERCRYDLKDCGGDNFGTMAVSQAVDALARVINFENSKKMKKTIPLNLDANLLELYTQSPKNKKNEKAAAKGKGKGKKKGGVKSVTLANATLDAEVEAKIQEEVEKRVEEQVKAAVEKRVKAELNKVEKEKSDSKTKEAKTAAEKKAAAKMAAEEKEMEAAAAKKKADAEAEAEAEKAAARAARAELAKREEEKKKAAEAAEAKAKAAAAAAAVPVMPARPLSTEARAKLHEQELKMVKLQDDLKKNAEAEAAVLKLQEANKAKQIHNAQVEAEEAEEEKDASDAALAPDADLWVKGQHGPTTPEEVVSEQLALASKQQETQILTPWSPYDEQRKKAEQMKIYDQQHPGSATIRASQERLGSNGDTGTYYPAQLFSASHPWTPEIQRMLDAGVPLPDGY